MALSAGNIRVMCPLFHAGEGGSSPTSALSLLIEKIDFVRARELNALWHSKLPRMGTGFVRNQPFLSFAATFGGIIYAVAIWSNPVARSLPQQEWLELRRLAISPDAPRNTASRMLRIMAILIKKEKPKIDRLISYHDTSVHDGGIYRAAGWEKGPLAKGHPWGSPSRHRPAGVSNADKQTWYKILRKEE